MATEQFLIVGAGLAGAKAAETLRADGFDGSIVLIGDEPERPYERPPLSKARLLGSAERDSVFVHTRQWYVDNEIDLRTGCRAESLDRSGRTLQLADGTTVGYDKLLLTTGSRPRRLDRPGADLPGVHTLRTLADADQLAPALAAGARVVVIGGGWIGLEVAAAASIRGAGVTVVDTLALPLQRVLGDDVGRVFLALHREHDVTFIGGASVRELRGGSRVSSVVLGDGTELPADVVVVGVGILPNVELARDAGLDTADGVVVDASLRTADPIVFAAGDVASAEHPLLGRRVRVEHWANALHGGPAAARAMLGHPVAYDRLPYFFTDQYDLGMEYTGFAPPGSYDTVVFRGDPATREFIAFWCTEDGRVRAGMSVNVWDVQSQVGELVRAGYSGRSVDLAKLADPSVGLTDLIPGG